jgi:hypothetical protein
MYNNKSDLVRYCSVNRTNVRETNTYHRKLGGDLRTFGRRRELIQNRLHVHSFKSMKSRLSVHSLYFRTQSAYYEVLHDPAHGYSPAPSRSLSAPLPRLARNLDLRALVLRWRYQTAGLSLAGSAGYGVAASVDACRNRSAPRSARSRRHRGLLRAGVVVLLRRFSGIDRNGPRHSHGQTMALAGFEPMTSLLPKEETCLHEGLIVFA